MGIDQKIWDFLIKKTNNAFGTAAIMGNLMAESSLNPRCVNGIRSTDDYICKADAGEIDFAGDGRAFGLVQWCYKTRKQGLLDMAKKRGTSVADINTQLTYLWEELKKYKTVYEAVVGATNIRDASDAVMLKYEKPAITTETAKAKRAVYAEKYYQRFTSDAPTTIEPEPKPPEMPCYVTALKNVNVRYGNATSYSKIGSLKTGETREWIATAENGWHAVKYNSARVGWVCGDYVEISRKMHLS